MLSFINITPEDCSELFSDCDSREMIRDILDGFSPLVYEGIELGCALKDDVLFIRICEDGDYMFPYPFALSDRADMTEAMIALSEYVRREMIPLRLTDTPREELSVITELFPHVNAKAYEDDEDTFFVRVLNECDLIDGDITAEYGRVVLNELVCEDKYDYTRQCMDDELNKYWGYDYKEDEPCPDENYFINVAIAERTQGSALSMAVRTDGKYIGECVLFDFDYRGECEVGIRILPEYRGMRYSGEILRACGALGKKMGLSLLKTRIMAENIPALRFVRSLMKEVKIEDGKHYFEMKL